MIDIIWSGLLVSLFGFSKHGRQKAFLLHFFLLLSSPPVVNNIGKPEEAPSRSALVNVPGAVD